MSSEIEILKYLNGVKKTVRYKGMKVRLFGLPDFKYYKYQTLANRCNILKQRGFIKETATGEYFITGKGRFYLEKQKDILKKFETQNNENSPKDLLIVYDIEENRKKERNWLRFHLKKFHFVMIQKSVWVGPSPLPKEFTDYLKEIKLGDNLKTFKLAKGYNL
jgi:DNA-binding transcriptional regulator PaaX